MKNYIKHIALFLLTISLVSCSNDDSQSQENNKFLRKVNLAGVLLNFFYNEDNTNERFETANYLVEFTYTNNRVSSIVEDEVHEYLFQYDANDIINSYSFNGQEFEVDFDSTTLMYNYERPDGFDVSIELYDNDEVKQIIVTNLADEEVTNFSVFYDTSKKGAMYNSNSFKVQSYIATSGLEIIAYVSKYPAQIFTHNDQSFSFVNTYDEDAFVVRADAGVNGVIDYFYSE